MSEITSQSTDFNNEEVQITEGGITDVNGLMPLGGSSDVGGTGTPDATADVGATTGAAGLDLTQSTLQPDKDMQDIRDSDLLGGDIIHGQDLDADAS